jgi:hypothetical protein
VTTTARTAQFARFVRIFQNLREVAPTLTDDQIAELRAVLASEAAARVRPPTPEEISVERAKAKFGRQYVLLAGN